MKKTLKYIFNLFIVFSLIFIQLSGYERISASNNELLQNTDMTNKDFYALNHVSVLYDYNENGTRIELGQFNEMNTAEKAMNQVRMLNTQTNNLVVTANGEVRNADYALVNFRTKASNSNTDYVEEKTGKPGYTNGTYGADAAFLGVTSDGKVRFMMSGVVGLVPSSEVEIVPWNRKFIINSYVVKNGELTHYICSKIGVKGEGSVSGRVITKAPDELEEGKGYYSYDGHYFYEDKVETDGFLTMINDYKNGVRSNASNKTVFYNYYQYLSHRSKSSYDAKDINNYIQNVLGYKKKLSSFPGGANESQLYDEGVSFVQYQNEFGANAMMMFGLARNESANGRSEIAFKKKNLFGHAAYDSSPGASASGYISVSQSIYAHAKSYISQGYLDPRDYLGRYNGGHFGDKASGMNIKYASDPYWGEKAAAYYYNFDKANGFEDLNKYTLAIKTSGTMINIYKEADPNSTVLFTSASKHGNNYISTSSYPVVVLSVITGKDNQQWYKIQSDSTLTSDRNAIIQDKGEYNFITNYAYVKASDFQILIPGKQSEEMFNVIFDPNGGKFSDGTEHPKVLTYEKYEVPEINEPTKEGYTFTGWDNELNPITSNVTYKATWDEKERINITFDANGGVFNDGKTAKVVATLPGVKPVVNEPSRSGYEFTGWTPEISVASKETTYKATWKKIDTPPVNPGEYVGNVFSFESLVNKNNQLVLTGSLALTGISDSNSINNTYYLLFKNQNNGTVVTQKITRFTNANKRNPNSWFTGNIDLTELADGDYTVEVKGVNGNKYSTAIISNQLFKQQVISFTGNGKTVVTRNDYYGKGKPLELIVRSSKIHDKNTNALANQFDQIRTLKFENGKLHLMGTSLSVGSNMAANSSVNRKIIFENQSDFKQYTFDLGSVTNGLYKASLNVPDGYDKTRAWYNTTIDISGLPKGNYAIYIGNTTNVSDFGEMKDLLFKVFGDESKATLNGKKFSFSRNDLKRYRIELKVE